MVVGFCVMTYVVPPDQKSFFPRCTLHETTGLNCPGCGGTRAVFALMHGDVLQAAADNLYFVLALPFLLWWGGYGVWATVVGKPFGPPPSAVAVRIHLGEPDRVYDPAQHPGGAVQLDGRRINSDVFSLCPLCLCG